MALSQSQFRTLQVLYQYKPTLMNYLEIAKRCGARPMDISNALRSLASIDLVYQLDMQGRTTITPDGCEELMNNM